MASGVGWVAGRRRFLLPFSVTSGLLILSGLLALYGLRDAWGQWLFVSGAAVLLLGFALAPLVHPKPLREP